MKNVLPFLIVLTILLVNSLFAAPAAHAQARCVSDTAAFTKNLGANSRKCVDAQRATRYECVSGYSLLPETGCVATNTPACTSNACATTPGGAVGGTACVYNFSELRYCCGSGQTLQAGRCQAPRQTSTPCANGEPISTNNPCACTGGTIQAGRCIYLTTQTTQTNGQNPQVFGQVEPPPGVAQFNARGGGGIGLIPFLSNLIRIATIVAGIIVFLNFILAGYKYLSSDGSAKVNEEVKNTLTYSVIGLLLIVASYTIIAIISLLLFGRADFILNPTISGPTGGTTP